MIFEFVVVVTFGFLLVKWAQQLNAKGKKLPPGPIGLPIVGHLPLLGLKPHRTMMKWAEIYGPVLSCRFGSHQTVVISDAKLIKQALSMSEFAGRAAIPSLLQGTSGKGIIFTEGPGSTEQRQFALKTLKDAGMGKKSMESKIQEDLLEFIEKIKARDGQPIQNTRLLSPHVVNSLWSIVMTEKLDEQKCRYLAEIVQERLSNIGSVISQLAFFIPLFETVMQTLSFGTKSLIQDRVEGFKEVYAYIGRQAAERNKSRVPNEPRDVNDVFFDKVDQTTDTSSTFHTNHDGAGHFNGDLFLGGIETTATTLEWMLYHMTKSPAVQEKLQTEIEAVVGSSRLPSLEDKPNMPYADAILYEVLRISSIFPFSVYHQTLSDVVLQGYHIPKGTMVLPNIYGVHHDPKVWGDPDTFRPERWLEESAKKLKSDHFMAFGSGKRSCVGESLARDQVWLYITTLFQRYNLSFDGAKDPQVEGIFGITLCPSPFKDFGVKSITATASVSSREVMSILRASWKRSARSPSLVLGVSPIPLKVLRDEPEWFRFRKIRGRQECPNVQNFTVVFPEEMIRIGENEIRWEAAADILKVLQIFPLPNPHLTRKIEKNIKTNTLHEILIYNLNVNVDNTTSTSSSSTTNTTKTTEFSSSHNEKRSSLVSTEEFKANYSEENLLNILDLSGRRKRVQKSWIESAQKIVNIHFYSRSALLQRNEYFFSVSLALYPQPY